MLKRESKLNRVPQALALVALGLLAPQPISAQAELSINRSGIRSFADAVRQLREKTGWPLSVEEPVWPAKAAASARTFRDAQGRQVEAPDEDRIQVGIPSLRGTGARPSAVSQLASAYNQQNPKLTMRVENLGSRTVFLPDSIQKDNGGARLAAQSVLSARIQVPVARRAPSQHMEEFLRAVGAESGIPVSLDTAAFGFRFDLGYTGKDQDLAFEWGTDLKTARLALAEFLDGSKTTTVWQVDCQVGVAPSPGHCILSVIPMTIEIRDSSGRITKRTLYFDRGGGEIPIPPPPPHQ